MPDLNVDIPPLDSQSAEPRALIFTKLAEGFSAIRKHSECAAPNKDAVLQLSSTPSFLKHATVNFIDPTSSSGKIDSPSKKAGAPLNIYQKLASIFEKEYHSTLRNVPYQHPRSGANASIERLHVQTCMTPSHGGLVTFDDSLDVPWAQSKSITGLGMDPCEWHYAPYCHVYIAACEGNEHYRNKVKQSIQVFLSQIEAVAKTTKELTDPGSTRYLIVFVPTGNSEKLDEHHPRGMHRMGAAWAAAKQRIARDAENSTGGTTAAVDGAEADAAQESDSVSGQVAVTQFLSKADRDLVRRVQSDFPAGIVCTMTTLMDTSSSNENDLDDENDIKRAEWSAFTKALGLAIAFGFRERCRKYDEELRRQDALRGAPAKDNAAKKFDMSNFFLLKESLAFTYEQMQLISEALLQYDELRAVLPDMKANATTHGAILDAPPVDGDRDQFAPLSNSSVLGDSVSFREQLRRLNEFQPFIHYIQQYLFMRETDLNFKLCRAVEVVQRSHKFVQSMYAFRKEMLVDRSDKACLASVDRWAFNFCWDVKNASDAYFNDKVSGTLDDDDMYSSSETGKAMCRHLSELLQIARLRMENIGELELDVSAICANGDTLSMELSEEWSTWNPLAAERLTDNHANDEKHVEDRLAPVEPDDFLKDALSSETSFVQRYLELLRMIESCNRRAGRLRCAARVSIHIADILIQNNKLEEAVKILKEISVTYSNDHWGWTHFFLLFRLATYQRKVSSADEYMDTLLQCFSPINSAVAPEKCLNFMLTDIEAVLTSSLVARSQFTYMPMFGPLIGLEDVKELSLTMPSRDLSKKVYYVGEKVNVTLLLESFLPRRIEAQEVTVDVVSFQAYCNSIDESIGINDDDILKVLRAPGPVTLLPGENVLALNWFPMKAGQYVLAGMSVKWHGSKFSYNSKQLKKRPTVCINVIPPKSTQCLTVTPDHLLPGHEQPVKISFSACADVIQRSSLNLICSPGLTILPPETEPENGNWRSKFEIDLPHCPPGETTEVIVIVKSSEIESTTDNGSNVLRITASSNFRPPIPIEEWGDSNGDTWSESNSIEKQIITIEKQALTADIVELTPYARDQAVLAIVLQCNTPTPLIIKGWDLLLPTFLALSSVGDMNNILVSTCLCQGQKLSIAFDCQFVDVEASAPVSDHELVIEFEDVLGNVYKESIRIALQQPTSTAFSLPNLKTINVQVVPSATVGIATKAITLVYKVDMSALKSLSGNIRYALSANVEDWFLCGKTEGLLTSEDISVLALPTRPGLISNYPAMSLFYFSDEGSGAEAIPFPGVDCSGPEAFHALARSTYTTVAVPVSNKASR
jgi:hypothetical protein